MEPVIVPINGVLDLHTFNPNDLPELLEEYIDACMEAGIDSLRIIHGKGIGVQRKRVRSILGKNPFVFSFSDAPEASGGWGATIVTLRGRENGREKEDPGDR